MVFLSGTTADGGVGGLELRNDKMEEIVSDHRVERKALEDSVLTLGDITMDTNHFRWIVAILKIVDSILCCGGILLSPLGLSLYIYWIKFEK